MAILDISYEHLVSRVGPRPMTFEEFLDYCGPDDDFELIDGALVERKMVQLEHEKLFGWLYITLGLWVRTRQLGILLGSRSAVKISDHKGRLPDLFFVSTPRKDIVQEKATYGPPDLVIELLSPSDRASDTIARETDYKSIGASEIVFIDQRKREVRILRRTKSRYKEQTLAKGTMEFKSLGGLRLDLAWLFDEPRPDERTIVDSQSD